MQSHVGVPATVLQVFPGFPGGFVLHWGNDGILFGLHSFPQKRRLASQPEVVELVVVFMVGPYGA